MSNLPPALDFSKTEEEICAKWAAEDTFKKQDQLSTERGDAVSRFLYVKTCRAVPMGRNMRWCCLQQTYRSDTPFSPAFCDWFTKISLLAPLLPLISHTSPHTTSQLTGIHLLRRPALRHGPTALRPHPSRDDQGRRNPLRMPDRTSRHPPRRVGLSRPTRRIRNRSKVEYHTSGSGACHGGG